MTDRKTIEYWKERLAKEDTYDSDCGELRRENGALIYQINKLIERINENEERIVRRKWNWWYMIHLAERTMRLFKLKRSIYDSKPATAYWRKYYMNQTCKIKPTTVDEICRDKIIGYLSEKMTESSNWSAYYQVIQDLKGMSND